MVDNAHAVNSLDGEEQVEIRELFICSALKTCAMPDKETDGRTADMLTRSWLMMCM